MRFVSLNAWGGKVWDALRDWVPSVNADVLCLQEVIRAPAFAPEWLQYEDPNRSLAQRGNLFADICALLPEHQAYFAPAARGPLTDDAGTEYVTEHGLGMWVHRRHAVTAFQSDFVYGAFRPDGWGPEPVPRSMQMAHLWSPDLKKPVIVSHFHGLRHPAGKMDVPERAVQAQRVTALLDGFCAPNTPTILAGDLNLLPQSDFFPMMEKRGLKDQVTRFGISDTRTSLYKKPQRYANYLLCTDDIFINRFDLPPSPEVSDHRPMILDFSF